MPLGLQRIAVCRAIAQNLQFLNGNLHRLARALRSDQVARNGQTGTRRHALEQGLGESFKVDDCLQIALATAVVEGDEAVRTKGAHPPLYGYGVAHLGLAQNVRYR